MYMSQSDIPPYTYIKLHSVNPRSQHEYKDIMVTALFWVVTQRAVVIYITDVSEQPYLSHLQGSRIVPSLLLEDGTDMLSRNVGKKLPQLAA